MASINHYVNEFERQLRLGNNASSTIATYTGILKVFLCRVYKDPAHITLIEDYLLTLNSTKTKRQCIYTLRHFYNSVMHLPYHLNGIPIPKQEKYIPSILNVEEIQRLVNSISNLKQRACIQQTFHRAKAAAGIKKKVTVHSLRHSRATHLVDNGVDMSLIQKFLGHAHIKTTVDFYLHTSIQTMQNIFAVADSKMVLPVQNISANQLSSPQQINQ